MVFYFAWVDPTDTAFSPTFAREDEQVLDVKLRHLEGEFAGLDIQVKNPRIGLLNAGRKRWAWLSKGTGTTVNELFFGRLIGQPTDLQGEVVTLSLRARPADFIDRQETAAEALKVDPFWDPLWIDPDQRETPDAVLAARSAEWHIHRTTHAVIASDRLEGAAGTIDVAGGFFHDSLRIDYGAPPLRAVKIKAELFWDQKASGVVDLTEQLVDACGGSGGKFKIITGEGVVSEWPDGPSRIGAGWSVGGRTKVKRVDREEDPQEWTEITLANASRIKFPHWTLRPVFRARYDVSRQRQETVVFTMRADVQSIVTDPGEDDVEIVTLSTTDVDAKGIDEPGVRPIVDTRRRTFLKTARGRRSLRYLLCLARAALRSRARAVEITFECPFALVADISCDHNVTITDPRLPGGTATGKVIGYELSANGDSGEIKAAVTIGCSVGKDTLVEAVTGSPVYVAGYVEDGYQGYTGDVKTILGGEIGYHGYDEVEIDDDGVPLFQMTPANVLLSITCSNTLGDQIDVLTGEAYEDAAAAYEAVNAAFAEISVDLLPLTGGPFHTRFPLTIEPLGLPKGIDLEAPSA